MKIHRNIAACKHFINQRFKSVGFGIISDPRGKKGKRWKLKTVLFSVLLAMFCLYKSVRQADAFTEDAGYLARVMGVFKRIPRATIGWILSLLDYNEIRLWLHRQIHEEYRGKSLKPTLLPFSCVAVDGKYSPALKRKWNRFCQKHNPKDRPPYWLFRVVSAVLISCAAKVTLDIIPIPASTNEMGIFAEFFISLMQIYGKSELIECITADAGFLSLKNANLVHSFDRGFVFAVKENQAELLDELQRLLLSKAHDEKPEAVTPWETAKNGKQVRRLFYRTTEIAGYLGWDCVRQGWMVVNEYRKVISKSNKAGKKSRRKRPSYIPLEPEYRFFITNLPFATLKPSQCLSLVRLHWGIENNCHGTLDLRFKEDDRPWVLKGNGLPVLSTLRRIAYNLFQLFHHIHLRSKKKRILPYYRIRDWIRDALRSVYPGILAQDYAEGFNPSLL